MKTELSETDLLTKCEPLVGAFELVFRRIASDPFSASAKTLIAFVSSFVNGEFFDLSRLERLTPRDQDLSLSVFDYCLSKGLSEKERLAIVAAFAYFFEICSTATRH